MRSTSGGACDFSAANRVEVRQRFVLVDVRGEELRRKLTGSVAGAAGVIALLTVFSRLAGLLRKLAQSWAMSDNAVATAYDTANTVPNVLFEVAAGGALAGAVVPVISKLLARRDKHALDQAASALTTWILLCGLPIAFLVVLGSDPIAQALFGSGADDSVVALASLLLKLFALQVPLYGLSVVFTGVLQAHRRFVLASLSPLMSSLLVITVFLLYGRLYGVHVAPAELPNTGVWLLGAGTTLGVVVFSLPQLIPVSRLVSLRPTLHFPPGIARLTVRLAGAGLAALVAQQVAIVYIMYVANAAGGVGTYSSYSYAYSIFMVPYAVLAVPIATAVFPRIAQAVANSDIALQVRLIRSSSQLVLAMGAVAAVLLVVLSEPARIVLEVGRNIDSLDLAMRTMAGALVGFSVLYHGARVMYALERPRNVVAVNTVAWLAVVSGLVVSQFLGVSGRASTLSAIGWSMTIGLSLGAALFVASLRIIFGPSVLTGSLRLAGFLAAALAVGGVAAEFVVDLLLHALGGGFLSAFVAAAAGAVLVLVCALLAIRLANPQLLHQRSGSQSLSHGEPPVHGVSRADTHFADYFETDVEDRDERQ